MATTIAIVIALAPSVLTAIGLLVCLFLGRKIEPYRGTIAKTLASGAVISVFGIIVALILAF
ncbi:MAG: hypothetical protein AB9915_03840 [Candidatus Dojkabacteria bacterium]